MKIYFLDDPATPGRYAQFSHVGTWSHGYVCKSCGHGTSILLEPIQVEWDFGTDRIGSFAWCGYTCIVLDQVLQFLINNKFECRFGRVEVMPPEKPTKRYKGIKRVSHPYTGPNLHWLIPTAQVKLNEERSGVKLESDCQACGQKHYTFRRTGIIIDSKNWNGQKMFLVDQFKKSGITFITESALELLNQQEFTNWKPLLAGEIV